MFSYYRVCSLTMFSYYRVCSLTIECVLLLYAASGDCSETDWGKVAEGFLVRTQLSVRQ